MSLTDRLHPAHARAIQVATFAGLLVASVMQPAHGAPPGQPAATPPAPEPALLLADRMAAAVIGPGEANAVVSPYGIEQVLGLIAAASSDALQAEMEASLGAPLEAVGQYGLLAVPTAGRLVSANSLWVQKGSIETTGSTAEAVASLFNAAVVEDDFASQGAAARVNAWFSQKTNGAVTDFIASISPQTRAVAAQALVFQAPWLNAFDPAATHDEPFARAPDGKPVPVAMMHAIQPMRHTRHDWGEVVEIAFQDERFSLVAALPRMNTPLDHVLPAILADLRQPADLAGRAFTLVEIAIPRLVFGSDLNLTEWAKAFGPSLLFSNQHALARLFRSPPTLAGIIQSCRFRMDEQGAEVAVGTVAVAPRSIGIPAVSVRFDRPFVFALRHRDLPPPLAIGYVADPSAP